jgi:hypothetical protein
MPVRYGSEVPKMLPTTRAWSEHRDINDVMLATSLVPSGFLALVV